HMVELNSFYLLCILEFESKCYYFSRETKNWMEANAICLEQNSNLMSIQSINERVRHKNTQDLINLWVRTQIATDIYWIGLNDRVTEGYSWSDGSPLSYTNWGHGEPNNHEGRENCVEMVVTKNGTYSWWNDLYYPKILKLFHLRQGLTTLFLLDPRFYHRLDSPL
uniref:C-type lectin domain-containing protein n=1 Tax=Mastacembelus armatus TaxID=205130 RepID=A0A3Q3ME95_9TELE